MNRSRWMALALAAAALISLPACVKRVHARPELSREASLESVAVMPPMVSIFKDKMTGGEGLVAESLMMEDKILTLVSDRLRQKGYEVKPSLTLTTLDQDAELKEAVTDLQGRHDDLLPVMARDLNGVSEGRFSMGGEVAPVGSAAEADLLVFVRAQGMVVSGGKRALVLIASLFQVSEENWLSMVITVVDARDGRVMATVQGVTGGSYLKSPDRLIGGALDKAFKKFPPAARRPENS